MSRRLPDRSSNTSGGNWPPQQQNYENNPDDDDEEEVQQEDTTGFDSNEFMNDENMMALMGYQRSPALATSSAPQDQNQIQNQNTSNYFPGLGPGDYEPQYQSQYANESFFDTSVFNNPDEEPNMINQYYNPNPAPTPAPTSFAPEAPDQGNYNPLLDNTPYLPYPSETYQSFFDSNVAPAAPAPATGSDQIPELTRNGRPNPFPFPINHPYIARLPVPITPSVPLTAPFPVTARGGSAGPGFPRRDRRLLNPLDNMWWNQPGQSHTNPSSDKCYPCIARRKRGECSLPRTSFPCTKCEEQGLKNQCRNGLPSREWEEAFLGGMAGETPDLQGRKSLKGGEVRLESVGRREKNDGDDSDGLGGDDGDAGDDGFFIRSFPKAKSGKGPGSKGGRTGIPRAGYRAPSPFVPAPPKAARGPERTVKRPVGRPRGSVGKPKAGLSTGRQSQDRSTGTPYTRPNPARRDEPEDQDEDQYAIPYQYPVPNQYPAPRLSLTSLPTLNDVPGQRETPTISDNTCDYCRFSQLFCPPLKPCKACKSAGVLCQDSSTGEFWPVLTDNERADPRAHSLFGTPVIAAGFSYTGPSDAPSAPSAPVAHNYTPTPTALQVPENDIWMGGGFGHSGSDDAFDYGSELPSAGSGNESEIQNLDNSDSNVQLNPYAAEPQQDTYLQAGNTYVTTPQTSAITPPRPGVGPDEYEDHVDRMIEELLSASQTWATIEAGADMPENVDPDPFALFGGDDGSQEAARRRDRDRLRSYQIYRAGHPRAQPPQGYPGFFLNSPPAFPGLTPSRGTPYGSRTSRPRNSVRQPSHLGSPLQYQPRIPAPVIQQALVNLPPYANWSWDGSGTHNGPPAWPFTSINPNRTIHGGRNGINVNMQNKACMELPRSQVFPDAENEENGGAAGGGVICGQAPVKACECCLASQAEHPANPFNTCLQCHQMRYERPAYTEEDLDSRKVFLCKPCARIAMGENGNDVTVARDCVCNTTMENTWLCHAHRNTVEFEYQGNLATAESTLISLGAEGMCVACNTLRADVGSGVFSCKICRDWVRA